MAKVESQSWSLLIPDDWSENKSDNNEQLYFESADNAMGFYISTYLNTANNVFELTQIGSNLKIERDTIDHMDGYNFKILNEKLLEEQELIIGTLDFYDQTNKYRIYIKYLGTKNKLIRISFHDYDCCWNENSVETANLIMDSLTLK